MGDLSPYAGEIVRLLTPSPRLRVEPAIPRVARRCSGLRAARTSVRPSAGRRGWRRRSRVSHRGGCHCRPRRCRSHRRCHRCRRCRCRRPHHRHRHNRRRGAARPRSRTASRTPRRRRKPPMANWTWSRGWRRWRRTKQCVSSGCPTTPNRRHHPNHPNRRPTPSPSQLSRSRRRCSAWRRTHRPRPR